jgi:hypothetical protein
VRVRDAAGLSSEQVLQVGLNDVPEVVAPPLEPETEAGSAPGPGTTPVGVSTSTSSAVSSPAASTATSTGTSTGTASSTPTSVTTATSITLTDESNALRSPAIASIAQIRSLASDPVQTTSSATATRPGATQGLLSLTLPGILDNPLSSSTSNPLTLNRSPGAERRELFGTAADPVTVQFERIVMNELLSAQSLLEGWWTNNWSGLSERLLSGERGDSAAEPDFVPVRQPDTQVPTDDVQTLLTDPVRVTGITLTAGVLWSLTRSGGLLTTILMGVPAWRHVDLLPVLANQPEDDEPEDLNDSESNPPESAVVAEMFEHTSRISNIPAA